MKLLEKYLNKKVIISEKLYNFSSTLDGTMTNGRNFVKGVITAIDNDYIELDNNTLITIKFIYRIQVIE